MNARIQANHAEFIADVTRGRGTRPTAELRRARYGEGRMFSSRDALASGLVDKGQPTREFYASMTAPKASVMTAKATARCSGRSIQRARLDLERLRTV